MVYGDRRVLRANSHQFVNMRLCHGKNKNTVLHFKSEAFALDFYYLTVQCEVL